MKRFLIFYFILLTACLISTSQTKRVAPGPHYEAGWLHEFFFGSHWRDVWTTPVNVEVIDLNTFGGGLTPLKKGGGLQTLSLRFKGGDGKEYKFRSIDKDPKKILPKLLQRTFAADIVQDQISSANPYAGFIVNEILKDVGVYHSEYQLGILPNDPKLGEFQKEFGGLLGLMETVPEEKMFEGSDKVIGTIKLLDRFNEEFDEWIDAKEYLKARLVDLYVGDWDRHKDQWKWIRYKVGENKIYKPFPTDRDQALSEFDGVFPQLAELMIPQFNHFGHEYNDIKYLTWNGRYVDQRFLTFISRADWDNVTNEVYSKLTDELIDRAVKKLPPEVYGITKDELTEKLKSRREEFKIASVEYYEFVNTEIDIFTTDKKDFIKVNFSGNGTDVTVYKRNKETGEAEKDFLRSKVFDNDITEEIRIYAQDGDDKFLITGIGENSPKIRLIGGDGQDEVDNKTDENVMFYDDGKKSIVKGDVGWDKDKYELSYEKYVKEYKKVKDNLSEDKQDEIEEKIGNLRYDPLSPPDKHSKTNFLPIIYYTPDIGPFLAGRLSYYNYGFRMDPYTYKLAFTAGYAPQKKDLTGLYLHFNGEFNGIGKPTQLNIDLRKSGIEINNYFGQGNETPYNDALYKSKYYRVQHEEYTVNPYFIFGRNKSLQFTLGLAYKYSHVLNPDITSILDSALIERKYNILGLKTGIKYDKRDHPTAPFKGYYSDLNVIYYPLSFQNGGYKFAKITGDIRGYIGHKTNVGLALRIFGEKVLGTYPKLESAFLGGSNSLRGFSSERFAGDASLMGSAELRLKLFDMFVLFPETIGIFAFGETGKVFLKGEKSNALHTSYGGGLYMHVIDRNVTLRLAYARSVERNMALYFGTGFSF